MTALPDVSTHAMASARWRPAEIAFWILAAACAEHGTIGYADFEGLLTQLHGLGFFPPNKLVSDVAHAAHGIELAGAA